MANKIVITAALMAASVMCGCDRRPSGVLGDKEMTMLLADMQVAQTYLTVEYRGQVTDSVRRLYAEAVLRKHGVTQAQVDSTLKWYGRNMDLYQGLYVAAAKELQRRQQQAVGGGLDDMLANDMWPLRRNALLLPDGTSETLAFSVPETDFGRGETVHWNFRLPLGANVQALLGVDYEGGGTAYLLRTFNSSRKVEMALQTDTAKNVKRLFGSVQVESRQELPLFIDSIALYTVPFDSMEYYRISQTRRSYGPQRKKSEAELAALRDSIQALRREMQEEAVGLVPQNTTRRERLMPPGMEHPVKMAPEM